MNTNELSIGVQIAHPKFGQGTIVDVDLNYYEVYFKSEQTTKSIDRNYAHLEIVDTSHSGGRYITLEEVEHVLYKLLDEHHALSETVEIGAKWIGGTLILEPQDENLQAKEIPLEVFFKKIIMVRDRLRVLEQNINSHDKLNAEEKIHLQQYITRAYGSLTTFNVLFRDKTHQFKGAGK